MAFELPSLLFIFENSTECRKISFDIVEAVIGSETTIQFNRA